MTANEENFSRYQAGFVAVSRTNDRPNILSESERLRWHEILHVYTNFTQLIGTLLFY